MVGTFLQTAGNLPGSTAGGLPGLGSVSDILGGTLAIAALVAAAVYIYFALAYSRIGEKAGISSPGIAWMPYMGPLATVYESSRQHWWPFAVLAGGPLLAAILTGIGVAGVGAVLAAIGLIVFAIMAIVWHWNTYENVGRPGWWALAPVITIIVGSLVALASSTAGAIINAIGVIGHLVFVGMAAWSESGSSTKVPVKKKTSKKKSKKKSKK